MSGISSLSGSSSTSLLSYLQNSSKTSGASGASCAGKSDQGGPMGFLTSELQDQGISGTDLDGLLKKIQEAVQSVTSGSDGKPNRDAIHDAVNKVLKDAGVDTDKIDNDLKAKGPRPYHKHATTSANSDTDDTDLDALLQSLGVDPAKFKKALESAWKNAGSDRDIDVSQLFASAAAGSQLDLKA
jgi:Clp amino terminal domain, pathogenicity island component